MKYALAYWHLLFLIVISFVLGSCSSSQLKPSRAELKVATSLEEAAAYEQLANQSTDASIRAVYQYLAAQTWYQQGFEDKAFFLFRNLDYQLLSPEQRLIRNLRLSNTYRERGELAIALEYLQDQQIEAELNLAEDSLKRQWASATAGLSSLLGNYERAFRAYDFALSYTDQYEAEDLRKSLWQNLTLIDEIPAPPYLSDETQGWVELAEINNKSSGTVSDQYLAYLLWQDRFYRHPANLNPPSSFAVLEQISTGKRPKVAILLPLTGNLATAGNAILDGYMSARASKYSDSNQAPLDPLAPEIIKVYDTATLSLLSITRDLSEQHIDLVIGPLDKNRVANYLDLMPMIPTLALNSLPKNSVALKKPIVGLALNVENESVQAATRALQEGHQSAMVLVPNSEWGNRAGSAFSDFWQSEGGDIIRFETYGDNTTHARLLEQSLQVNQSNNRQQTLQQLLGKSITFTPRRRQDIDALFLAASPSQARQLKPMLAFFFAENIPVYSTSSIYSGHPDTKADRDLDGIQFSTLPWILDSDTGLRSVISADFAPSATQLKMQAIGVDSYFLSQRLAQFLQAPDTVYRGVIGKLGRDANNKNLNRQQVWAKFRGGLARANNN